MACKTVTLPPFKATLTEKNPSTVAESLKSSAPISVELNLTTSERK